jgi:hypothetical protein
VNMRAVWQKQGGDYPDLERFLYYSNIGAESGWYCSSRKSLEIGNNSEFLRLISAALTPNHARPLVWEVACGSTSTKFVANSEVQVRR